MLDPHETELKLKYFDAYTSEHLDGVVLLIGNDAVLMWGDPGVSVGDKKVAVGWGTFVSEKLRGEGAGNLLRETALKMLADKGFVEVTCVVPDNHEDSLKGLEELGFGRISTILKKDICAATQGE